MSLGSWLDGPMEPAPGHGHMLAVSGDDATDTHYLRAAASGDDRAWEALIEEHLPPVWSHLRDSALDENEAADVCDVVWLRLVQALDDTLPSPLRPWLISTAETELRRRRRLSERGPRPSSPPVYHL